MIEYLKNPIYLTWVITNRCNLRCKFCYLENYIGQDLTLEETKKVINIIKDKQFIHVSLLGGEPTEFKHFCYVISKLEKLKISYSFSTNAQKLSVNNELLSLLSKSKYLTEVQVSLESPIKEINDEVRGGGTYDKTLEGVQIMSKKKVPVKIAMVLTKKNKHTVQEMIYLASELGAKKLRLMPFVPVGTGFLAKEQLFLSYEELVKTCSGLKIPANLTVSTYLKDDLSSQKNTFGCGAGTTVCVMNHDLTLSACPLEAQWKKTSYKVIDSESFDEIWSTSKIFDIWRRGEYREVTKCNMCPLFASCGGYT